MVNSRDSLSKIPTMNNDANPYIITLDIYKEGYWAYDISNYYKGRVDDNGTPFMVRWFEHGQIKNVQGLRPFIRGTVGQHTIDDQTDPDNPKVVPSSDCSQIDQTGETTDTAPGGIAIYRMVNACFTQEGMFYGEIGLKDSSGLVLSSVDIAFKVLGGRMNMIGARKFYVSEFEKALDNLNEIIEKTKKDFSQELRQVIDDARNEYLTQTKASHDANVAADAEINAIRADAKDLADQIGSQQDYINAHNIVTTDKFDDLSNNLTKYVTESFVQPEAYDNLDELKAAYPTGAKGIFVTTDTGHFFVWQNNKWKDCGAFQASGIPDNSISLEKMTDSLQNSFEANTQEVILDHLNTGYLLINGNIVSDSRSVYTNEIPVKIGEEYYVTGKNFWNARLVILKGSNNEIKDYYPKTNDNDPCTLKITIPKDVSSMVVNSDASFPPRIFKIINYNKKDDAINSFKMLFKNKSMVFEDVSLNPLGSKGYWRADNGTFCPEPVDKTKDQIAYSPIKVQPLETYRVHGSSSWNAKLFVLLNAKGNVIDYYPKETFNDNSHTDLDTIITIPSDGAFLEVNQYLNAPSTVKKAIALQSEPLPDGYYSDVTEINLELSEGFISKYDNKIITTPATDKDVSSPVHATVAVNAGEEYYIHTQNYYAGQAVIFRHKDEIVQVLPSEDNANIVSFKFTVPNGVDTLALNGSQMFPPRLFKVEKYVQASQNSTKAIANILNNSQLKFKEVSLTPEKENGYWDPFHGGFMGASPAQDISAIAYKPIKVKPYEIYRVSGGSNYNAKLYTIIDYAGNPLASYPDSTNLETNLSNVVTIPEKGAYIEISQYPSDVTTKLEKAVSVDTRPLIDKKWNAIGDSWTYNYADKKQSYVDDVAEITGVTAVNRGAGGTGYLSGDPKKMDWFTPFYERKIDNDADIYTVFGSFNDAYLNYFKFGQKGDTGTDTLWGCLLKTVNNIYTNNPNAAVGLITPGPWGAINPFETNKMSTLGTYEDTTINDMAINDFAEKYVGIIQEFAKLYSLPCLDLFHESNLRPWSNDFINSYYHGESATDTTHPNPAAMKKYIAPKVAKFIESFA